LKEEGTEEAKEKGRRKGFFFYHQKHEQGT